MEGGLAAFEEGGPNDPKVAFKALRESLTLVKDELSPYGWRAYDNEFRDKQRAERKLLALNRLPGSGLEPKDGMLDGTPLWQERLDKMMLIEHLKKKVMYAHGLFAEASECMLKSHSWLVKDELLGDSFVKCITHVPPSQHERVDILQGKLEASRLKIQALENEFEDFQLKCRKDREAHLQRITEHQKRQNDRRLYDDIVISWSYRANRDQALQLDEIRRVLEARVFSLECTSAARADELEEFLRQWSFDMDILTKDRDKFKKLYEKMVRAHEQALEDLKNSADTAEGRAQMIQVLSVEKQRLSDQVDELEEWKRDATQQLSDARVEIARQNKEMRRRMLQFRETEELLLEFRLEVERLEGTQRENRALLDSCGVLEASLRDDLAVARGEILLLQAKAAEVRVDLGAEQRVRRGVEAERDLAIDLARRLETKIVANDNEHARVLQEVKDRAVKELRDTVEELTTKHEGIQAKLEKRNKMLEREVAVGDDIGQNLPVLNPITVDDAYVCRICRKTIMYEGPPELPPNPQPPPHNKPEGEG